MALFNEIQVGRYNRLLQKLFSMKGPAPAPQLSSEIFPMLLIEQFGVESRYLVGWDRFGLRIVQAGAVGLTTSFRFRNPGGSNAIAVVEKLTYSSNLAGRLDIFNLLTDVDLAAIALSNRLDSRGRAASTVVPSSGNGSAGGTLVFGAENLVSTPYELVTFENQEVPLLPGQQLEVRTSNLNAALTVATFWRERYLEDSERT